MLHRNFEAARSLLEEALEIDREAGDSWEGAQSLRTLGDVAECQELYDQAVRYYKESLALYRQMGDRLRMAALLRYVGSATSHLGDHTEAMHLFRKSLDLYQQLGHEHGMLLCIAMMAAALSSDAGPFEATVILSAASTLLQTRHLGMWPVDQIEYEATISALRTALGDEKYSSAWKEGQTLSLPQLLNTLAAQ